MIFPLPHLSQLLLSNYVQLEKNWERGKGEEAGCEGGSEGRDLCIDHDEKHLK